MNNIEQRPKIDISPYYKYFKYINLLSIIFLVAPIISVALKFYFNVSIENIKYDLTFLFEIASIYFCLAIVYLIMKKEKDIKILSWVLYGVGNQFVIFSWGMLVFMGKDPENSQMIDSFIPYDIIPSVSNFLFSGMYIGLFSLFILQIILYSLALTISSKLVKEGRTEVEKLTSIKEKKQKNYSSILTIFITLTTSISIAMIMYYMNFSYEVWINFPLVVGMIVYPIYKFVKAKIQIEKTNSQFSTKFITMLSVYSILLLSTLSLYILSATIWINTQLGGIMMLVVMMVSTFSILTFEAIEQSTLRNRQLKTMGITKLEAKQQEMRITEEAKYQSIDSLTKIGICITYCLSTIIGFVLVFSGVTFAFAIFPLIAFVSCYSLWLRDSRTRKYAIIFSIIGGGIIGGIFIWIGKPTKQITPVENDINPVV